jgi:hypothetical protein
MQNLALHGPGIQKSQFVLVRLKVVPFKSLIILSNEPFKRSSTF